MFLVISKQKFRTLFATTLLVIGNAHAACTVSGQDDAKTLECDPQTLNKAKTTPGSHAAVAAPAETFVATGNHAGTFTADTSPRKEGAGTLRPMSKEEKAAFDASQTRK